MGELEEEAGGMSTVTSEEASGVCMAAARRSRRGIVAWPRRRLRAREWDGGLEIFASVSACGRAARTCHRGGRRSACMDVLLAKAFSLFSMRNNHASMRLEAQQACEASERLIEGRSARRSSRTFK